MKTSTTVWIIVIILVLGAGWYVLKGSSNQSATTQPSTGSGMQASTTPATTTAGPTIAPPVVTITQSATLGSYLASTQGMTLYTYSKDTTGVSNCTGTCATNWPPYTLAADDTLALGPGIAGKLTTLVRADGSIQVEYNGMPLYYWKNDKKPGDTTGQNVGGFVVAKP